MELAVKGKSETAREVHMSHSVIAASPSVESTRWYQDSKRLQKTRVRLPIRDKPILGTIRRSVTAKRILALP
jgi:hypothetical protein